MVNTVIGMPDEICLHLLKNGMPFKDWGRREQVGHAEAVPVPPSAF
jgi:hypothetical protein